MVVNRKVTGTASTMPVGFALGLLCSLGITCGGAGIWALLAGRETLGENTVGFCAMVLILLSAVAGPAVAVGRIKRRRVFVCGISGILYFGTLLSMTALFFGGQYQGIGVTALLVLAGSTLVAMLGLRQERSASYRKRRRGGR